MTTGFENKTNIYKPLIIQNVFSLSFLGNKLTTTGMKETGRVSAELGLTQQGQHGLHRPSKEIVDIL